MIRRFLFGIDLFGISVPINFSGKEKSNSKLGGTCSLMFFCFVGWTIYNASDDLINKKNPNIFSFEAYTEDPKEIAFSSENFPIGIQIQAPNALLNKPYINDSIYKLRIFYNFLEKINHKNGTVGEKWTFINIATERCTPEHFGNLAPSFGSLVLDSFHCIAQKQLELDTIYIQGVHESPIYRSLTISVMECDNATSAIECASEDTLNAYLEGAQFNLLYANLAINLQSFSYPTSRFKDSYKTTISRGFTKTTTIELSKVGVTTDLGWIVKTEDRSDFVKVNKITEGIQLENEAEKALISCGFQASKVENYYSRSYKKIQNVLSEVGGLANALFVIFLIMITPYLKFKVQESLMNELFEINITTKVQRTKTKSFTFHPQTASEKYRTEKAADDNSEYIGSEYLDKKFDKSDVQKDESKLSQYIRQLSASSSTLNRPKINFQAASEQRVDTFLNWTTQFQPNSSNENSQKRSSISSAFKKASKNGSPNEISSVEMLEKTEAVNINRNSAPEKPPSIGPNSLDEPIALNSPLNKASNHQIIEVSKKGILKKRSVGQSMSRNGSMCDLVSNINSQEEINEDLKNENLGSRKFSKNIKLKRLGNLSKVDGEKSIKITLNLWEYVFSFFYQSDQLKKKLELMEKGLKNINHRLDVINILKKLRELDKLKVLILDPEQLLLFNNMPKPEIFLNNQATLDRRKSFSRETLKKLTFIQGPAPVAQIFASFENIKARKPKTNIDERLLEIFEDLESSSVTN